MNDSTNFVVVELLGIVDSLSGTCIEIVLIDLCALSSNTDRL